jgi:3-oxoadipate enol-lactonase
VLPVHEQVEGVAVEPPVTERLREIRVPTLVVLGAEDVPDVALIADVLEAGIPDTRRETIAGAAHLPSLERPDELNALLLDFLHDGV